MGSRMPSVCGYFFITSKIWANSRCTSAAPGLSLSCGSNISVHEMMTMITWMWVLGACMRACVRAGGGGEGGRGSMDTHQ